jgi:hypothetical protein
LTNATYQGGLSRPITTFDCSRQSVDIALEQIDRIESIFGPRPDKRDVISGLKCKAYLNKGNFRVAIMHWDNIDKKDLIVHKKLRCGILNQIISSSDVGIEERNSDRDELERLSKEFDNDNEYNIYCEADEPF